MSRFKDIKRGENVAEIKEALIFFFINRMSLDEKIEVDEFSTMPKRRELVIDLIKLFIDESTFKTYGFTLLFNDASFSIVKKIETVLPKKEEEDDSKKL